mgnify:CR=1 FL=1
MRVLSGIRRMGESDSVLLGACYGTLISIISFLSIITHHEIARRGINRKLASGILTLVMC